MGSQVWVNCPKFTGDGDGDEGNDDDDRQETGLSNGVGPNTMIAIIISLPWAAKRITQIVKSYDQTSKCPISGSRRALEELKKGKSSEFDGQNDSQVDSGPVDRSDSIDTRGLYSDIKNSRVGPNQGVLSHFELLSKIKRDIF